MKTIKKETRYFVVTGGKDDYGMNVGSRYEFDNEEDMVKFLNGDCDLNFYQTMSYYEYPIDVYSKAEYEIIWNDDENQ